jgi:DNA-binding FadR family transcriptional regulator
MNSPFANRGSRRIHGLIARDLGVAIVSGKPAPGDLLFGEVEYADKFGVSRSAYREAIRILIAKGLVESRPKIGTRVCPGNQWNLLDPEVLGWMFETEPSDDFISGLFELRAIVEPAAAELAALRRDGKDLARMGHALEEMSRHGLFTAAGREGDQAFHNSILEATRNAPLISLSSSIAAAVSWTTIFKQRKRRLPRDPLPEHRAVYDAITKGDRKRARTTMLALVQLALEDTQTSLRD